MKISEVLKGDKIKFTKKGNKKYYSIISVLEELDVSKRARKYWYDAKKKIEKTDKKILENIESLKVEASDGKNRVLDCASKSDIELILKNIPSKKVKALFNKDEKKKVEEEKKSTKKTINKIAKKEVKKEVKKETKKAVKKVSTKKLEKKYDKVEKAARKAIKKETKKVVKDIDESKVIKKPKGNKKDIKKVIKKSVKKEIKKDVKKKKCGIICGIIKIFA